MERPDRCNLYELQELFNRDRQFDDEQLIHAVYSKEQAPNEHQFVVVLNDPLTDHYIAQNVLVYWDGEWVLTDQCSVWCYTDDLNEAIEQMNKQVRER